MTVERILTGRLSTNTYLIIEGTDAIVIDPGADYEQIVARLNKLGAKAKYILITHAHYDHIGAVAQFAASGAKVYISKIDYDILIKSEFYVDLGMFGESVQEFPADVTLSDGDKFTICNHDFTVLSTPGHTPGGVCYITENYIFTGDTLFRLSVGRTDFPHGSYDDLMQSVKKLFALTGEYIVLPGHGTITTLDYERNNNPYVC